MRSARLAVIDAAAVEVVADPEDQDLRDAVGRRFPPHLDVRPVIEAVDWWAHWYEIPRDRWQPDPPVFTYDLSRRLRDARRQLREAGPGSADPRSTQ